MMADVERDEEERLNDSVEGRVVLIVIGIGSLVAILADTIERTTLYYYAILQLKAKVLEGYG